MTPKQKRFVEQKLFGLSNRAAVIAAGYSAAGAKQRGTQLMNHPAVRAELRRGGFQLQTKREMFDPSAARWLAVSAEMHKKIYDCPMEFLTDAMNCRALPKLDRMCYAAALLPYVHARIR